MKLAAMAGRPRVQVYALVHLVLFLGGLVLMASRVGALFAIGTGVSATGITGLALLVYVYLTENTASQLALLATFGLTHAFATRSVAIRPEYDQRLAAAHSKIDIIGFGLRSLRQDYLSEFANWRQRAAVRILILDPAFPSAEHRLADQRDREEGESVGTIQGDVQRFIADTAPFRNERFQVKAYRCIPTINYFRIDDEAFWGPYLVSGQSRNLPTFIVRRGGKLFDRLAQHFEDIWTNPQLSVELASIDEQARTNN